tara:strand:- start:64 stop:288 length:225 start_codon:yes stop_codon:yes gene_type:complete
MFRRNLIFRRNLVLGVRYLHDRKLPSVKPSKKNKTKLIGTSSPKKANYKSNEKKNKTKLIDTSSPKKIHQVNIL